MSPPPSQQSEGAFKKLLVGAGCTLIFEGMCGHLLEFTKVVKQTKPELSYARVVQGIVGEKGVLGMWDGFMPWGAAQVRCRPLSEALRPASGEPLVLRCAARTYSYSSPSTADTLH